MEPKMPRDEILDRFRRQFFKVEYGVGYLEGAHDLEEFKETQMEEDAENGLVMNPSQRIGLIIGEGNLSNRLLAKARKVEPMVRDYDLEVIDLLTVSATTLKIVESTFSPKKVIQALKVIGDEDELGVVKNIKTYPLGEDEVVIFENEHGEMIALAPYIGGEPVSYEELIEKEFTEAREFAEALRDPNLLRITDTSDTKINIPIDQIERVEVTHSGISLHLNEWGYSPSITRETLDQIRESIPNILIEDTRTSYYEIKWDKVVDAVSSAWKKRDPLLEDIDGYNKCLEDVAERIQFCGGLPCSLDFYVQNWGLKPKERKYNYRLRSLHTPAEWAGALTKKIMAHVYKAELDLGSGFEGVRSGSMRLYFKIPEEEILPVLRINPTEYKAKHLKQFKSVVDLFDPEHNNSDWRVWELREIIAQFEVDEVKT